MRGTIKIKKYLPRSAILSVVKRDCARGATSEGEKKGEVFLIIHKNLDEFVTFRHLAGIKNKVTTAGKW